MKCLACNVTLNDNEANRKFSNHSEIVNPEDKYIGLCSNCMSDDDDYAEELVNPYVELYE